MMKMNRGSNNPLEMMCEMMGQMGRADGGGARLTPELTQLFEEWVAHLENEILEKNRGNQNVGLDVLMEQLGLSKESVICLIARLATRNKVALTISIE